MFIFLGNVFATLLRLHAKLCEGRFFFVEVDEHFLKFK